MGTIGEFRCQHRKLVAGRKDIHFMSIKCEAPIFYGEFWQPT